MVVMILDEAHLVAEVGEDRGERRQADLELDGEGQHPEGQVAHARQRAKAFSPREKQTRPPRSDNPRPPRKPYICSRPMSSAVKSAKSNCRSSRRRVAADKPAQPGQMQDGVQAVHAITSSRAVMYSRPIRLG